MTVVTGTQGERRRPSRLSREDRREHFLEVTAELILESGVDSVTMEGTAARAGVSKGLGYAYFPNRTELIRALFDREMMALDRQVREELETADSLEDKVRATIHAWFAVLSERGQLIAILLQGKLSDGPLEEHRRARQQENREWWAAVLEDELGLPPKHALAAASMVLASSTAAFDLWSTRRGSRRDLEDMFVTMAMGGLRAVAAQHGAT